MSKDIQTILLPSHKQDERIVFTCAYSAAIVMRIYEDGHVESLDFRGETMDELCKTWQEYRQQASAPCIGCGRVVTEGVEVMHDPITHKLQCVCKECEKEL